MLRVRSFDNGSEPGPENDIITDYLTIRGVNPNIILNCSFRVSKVNNLTELSYSVDDGPWITTTSLVPKSTITAPPGNKIKWRGVGTCVGEFDEGNWGIFKVDLPFVVQGSLLSLIQKLDIIAPHAFSFLFFNLPLLYSQFSDSKGNIIDAEITFPTNVTEYCYRYMFYGCSNMERVPTFLLPATVLAKGCYSNMFEYCTKLTLIPSTFLPATTLAPDCYSFMFRKCSIESLASFSLPATTLAEGCYSTMFSGCSIKSLLSFSLPATTLVRSCYSYMFSGCSIKSLLSFSLPATTLAPYCYEGMFTSMSSLETFIPIGLLHVTTLAEGCYWGMFDLAFADSVNTFYCDRLPATVLAENCYAYMFGRNDFEYILGTLPATTLAPGCYSYMFRNNVFRTIPAGLLPATTLVERCYYGMFEASRLNNLTTNLLVLPATTLAPKCYEKMFYGYPYEVNGTNAAYYCTINKLTFHGTIPDNTYAKDMLGLVRYSGTVYYKASVDSNTSKMSGWLPSNWSTSAI